jgi:DNA-directed RNA polymerase sigma subunit (sigma70/sigma32)
MPTSRSEHTTKRNATPARATRAHTDEKRRPAPAASTTRRRGAEQTEVVAKPTAAKATKAAAPKKAPAKKRMPKNAKIERPELDPAVAAAHAQADDVTTDSLQLFFNAARKYPLLTAAQEIELAKRIEKGDMDAKDRMINSNLRLVVSVARKYQGHGLTLGDLVQEGPGPHAQLPGLAGRT